MKTNGKVFMLKWNLEFLKTAAFFGGPVNLVGETREYVDGFGEYQDELSWAILQARTIEEVERIVLEIHDKQQKIHVSFKKGDYLGIYATEEEKQYESGRYYAAFVSKKVLKEFTDNE